MRGISSFLIGVLLGAVHISCANVPAMESDLPSTSCGAIVQQGEEIRRYQLPVLYYIDDSVPPEIAQATLEAANNMNALAGKELLRLVPKSQGAEPISYHGSDWEFPPNNIAVTRIWAWGGIMYTAPIYINGVRTAEMSYEEIVVVMEHEFGHGLGLDHKDQQDSLMYPTSGHFFGNYADTKAILDCLYK